MSSLERYLGEENLSSSMFVVPTELTNVGTECGVVNHILQKFGVIRSSVQPRSGPQKLILIRKLNNEQSELNNALLSMKPCKLHRHKE